MLKLILALPLMIIRALQEDAYAIDPRDIRLNTVEISSEYQQIIGR